MDVMGWGLTALAAAALAGVLVVGHLGAIALRRCSEADIAAVLDRVIRLFGTVRGNSHAVEQVLSGEPKAGSVSSLVRAGLGEDV